jgi:ABC-2 type transport system ATP-binding protein
MPAGRWQKEKQMSTVIKTDKLTKSYGRSRGIFEVTFETQKGEIFGFLGPNGAGKTTTMRVLMGLLHANSGSATIAGLDCWTQSTEVKKLVGYLPGEFAFDPGLRGAQIIEYLGHLRGGVDQPYLRSLVERLGLDPLNQQEFYQMVAEVRAEGRTVFLSSHILPEVEHTCDRVAIIREGRLIKVDHVSSLKEIHQHDVEITFAGLAEASWFKVAGVANVAEAADKHTLQLSVQGDLREIIHIASQHNATTMTTHEPTLEEVFLRFYASDQQSSALAR